MGSGAARVQAVGEDMDRSSVLMPYKEPEPPVTSNTWGDIGTEVNKNRRTWITQSFAHGICNGNFSFVSKAYCLVLFVLDSDGNFLSSSTQKV